MFLPPHFLTKKIRCWFRHCLSRLHDLVWLSVVWPTNRIYFATASSTHLERSQILCSLADILSSDDPDAIYRSYESSSHIRSVSVPVSSHPTEGSRAGQVVCCCAEGPCESVVVYKNERKHYALKKIGEKESRSFCIRSSCRSSEYQSERSSGASLGLLCFFLTI